MRMFTSIRRIAAVAALPLLLASAAPVSALAQSIDYSSLESLFNEPVTTSATGSPQRSTEVPVDMTIISAEDIRRSGATDIPTILSRVAGVDILPFSSGAAELSVRGYDQSRSPRMLVLINGRQVYLDHFGYTDWYTVPVALDEIRQIELVRGPNSALFGFNAVSGVINIITYNPKYDTTRTFTARAGGLNHASASLIDTFKLGPVKTRLSLSTDSQDEWKNLSSTVTAAQLRNPQTVRMSADSVIELSPKTDLRFETSYSNSTLTEMLSSYSYVASRVKTGSAKVSLDTDTDYGSVRAQVYVNELDSAALPLHYYNTIMVANVQDLIKVGSDHTFRFALEYRDNKVNTTPVTGGEVGYRVLAPSAMLTWQVSPKLAITAAARNDTLKLRRSGVFPAGVPYTTNALWDRTINAVSLNFGTVITLSDTDTLRFTAARGVQAPTLVELGSRQVLPTTSAPTGLANLGNPLLRPAKVANYEIDYGRAIPRWNARFSIKLFSQQTNDVKSGSSKNQIDIPATSTTYAVYTYLNMGKSKMKGGELSASGRFGTGFRWSADTTRVEIEDEPTAGYNPVVRLIAYSKTAPKYRSNLSLGWTNGKWTADGYLHAVSRFNSYVGSALEAVPAYTSFAGRVAYKTGNGLEVSLNGQNLLEARQEQAKGITGLAAQRRILLAVTKSW